MKKNTQIWASINLDVSTFRNGDVIPEAKTNEEWVDAGINHTPVWCYYNNEPTNKKKFGKLYNWYAVMDPRGLAPEGWHIPSDSEWTKLISSLGGKDIAGKKMKSTVGWHVKGNGDNSSGFAGLPGGFRAYNGVFLNKGDFGYWWCTTEYNPFFSWYRILYNSYDFVYKDFYFKGYGMSVRCIKD